MVSLRSPKFTLIKGALWAVGTRWSIKAIGFFNTVIMARLLLPADYGVVAMSMLVVGLIQAFMDTGVGAALLRKEDLAQDEIDSAWTLRLMQSMAVGVALLAISPVVANYFEESRVQAILWVLALCIVLEGAG
ncbi:MAG: oligosaccharide flippase family protein, partial [Simplicispira sp.]|nr:oligosaccharide flippase family protein [Simplicispira sp.]